jgi:membrane protein insertase Oxa1/YidC/SpoIIIJ
LKPIQKPLRKIEARTSKIIKLIENEYNALAKGMNSEQQFILRDSLYRKHSYNPFHSIKQAISFFALIPFLISVIIIFQDSDYIQSTNAFGISLNNPDGLLFGFNLFPIIMFLSTYLDSKFRYANDQSSKNRFLVISIVLFFLVYNLPSALIIFWIFMNFINMGLFYLKK